MGNLYFLIGLPRSGKSTIAKKWASGYINIDKNSIIERDVPSWGSPRVIVCGDDIRLSLGHRYNIDVENYVSAIKDTMIKTLLKKHDVLVDGTHTTKNHILSLLHIDPKAQYYYLDTPVDICEERAVEAIQEDLYTSINRMRHNLFNLREGGSLSDTIDKLREEAKQTRFTNNICV